MKIGVTSHAIARYVERVKPALGHDQARRELLALAATVTDVVDHTATPFADRVDHSDASFAEIAPGIWLALKPNGSRYEATTVLTVGSYSDTHRQRVNRAKQAERRAKRQKRQNEGGRMNRPPRMEDAA